jgi:hypothetical protein
MVVAILVIAVVLVGRLQVLVVREGAVLVKAAMVTIHQALTLVVMVQLELPYLA